MSIHPTAVVHPTAALADGVVIGPYSVIEENASIGEGTVLANNVTIRRNVSLGKGNVVHPCVVLGGPPQDLGYRGDATMLRIGDENTIREHVTINIGTAKGGGLTTIGNKNFLMTGCHIAHDCILEDEIIITNAVLLAGHILVERNAVLSGAAACHHFSTIGRFAFVGGLSRIVQDAPPFMIVEGNPSRVRGVNAVGLKRAGFTDDKIEALKVAHRSIFRTSQVRREVLLEMKRSGELTPEVSYLIEFLLRSSAAQYGRARESLRTW